MSDDGVELARFTEASDARDAGRRLLAAGLTPTVRRDGPAHVLTVAPAQAAAAAELLAIDPATVVGAASVAADRLPGDGGEGGDTSGEGGSGDGAADDGEDELDELVVDERGFVVVAVSDGPDEAREVAARLLVAGIPSEMCSAFVTGHANPMTAAGDPQAVQVLEVDADRALGVLGADQLPRRLPRPVESASVVPGAEAGAEAALEPAAARPEVRLRKRTEVEEVRPYLGGRVNLTRRQLRTMIALYIAALILIPLAFFLATRWLLTPDVERPELPEVPVDAVVPLTELEGWSVALPPGWP